jgi:hypothetical protein
MAQTFLEDLLPDATEEELSADDNEASEVVPATSSRVLGSEMHSL